MVRMMLPYSAVMLISPQQPHYCHRCQHQHAHHLNHRHNHHLIITIVIIIKIIVIRNHFGWNLYRQQTTGRLPWANGLYFLEDGDLARFIVVKIGFDPDEAVAVIMPPGPILTAMTTEAVSD
jgi:hypothetical protein